MSKFIPNPPPTLDETVNRYGGIENYLNDPEIRQQNNGLNAHDIFLLLEVSYAAAAAQTGRNRRTVRRWKSIKERENQNESADVART